MSAGAGAYSPLPRQGTDVILPGVFVSAARALRAILSAEAVPIVAIVAEQVPEVAHCARITRREVRRGHRIAGQPHER